MFPHKLEEQAKRAGRRAEKDSSSPKAPDMDPPTNPVAHDPSAAGSFESNGTPQAFSLHHWMNVGLWIGVTASDHSPAGPVYNPVDYCTRIFLSLRLEDNDIASVDRIPGCFL